MYLEIPPRDWVKLIILQMVQHHFFQLLNISPSCFHRLPVVPVAEKAPRPRLPGCAELCRAPMFCNDATVAAVASEVVAGTVATATGGWWADGIPGDPPRIRI